MANTTVTPTPSNVSTSSDISSVTQTGLNISIFNASSFNLKAGWGSNSGTITSKSK